MGYNYYGSYSPSSYDVAAASTAVLGALMVYLVIILAIVVIQIIAMWKIFTKAGEKGWKAIVPIYNLVILYKICGLSPWLIFAYLATIIPFIGWIVLIGLNALLCYKLAKSFGKDAGWAVGLYFLAPIFYMILGFGQSQYVGPDGETMTSNATTANNQTENN